MGGVVRVQRWGGVGIAGDRLVGGGSRDVEERNAGTCHCQNSERYSLIYVKK